MSISVGDRALTWEERFWRRVQKTDGCWNWTGGRGGTPAHPYGVYMLPGQRRRGAHVIAYEMAHGPMMSGLVIDHLCLNTLCVRADHLEAVSPAENRRRQVARQTHCRSGHAFVGANLYEHEGKRYCRRCRAAAQRRYLARAA